MADALLSRKLESIAAELHKLNETMRHMADILEACQHQMKPSNTSSEMGQPPSKDQ